MTRRVGRAKGGAADTLLSRDALSAAVASRGRTVIPSAGPCDRSTRRRSISVMTRTLWLQLTVSIALVGCRSAAGPITIAAAGPWQQPYGAETLRGIKLAVAEINAAGGIDGRSLELIDRDDSGSGARAVATAAGFLANSRIVGVIGHVTSGSTLAAARIYDRGLPVIASAATSPDLSGISPWVFRIIPSDSLTGMDLARFADSHRMTTAAVLYESDAYGRGLARAFQRQYRGKILISVPIDPAHATSEPYVTRLKALQPSLVFLAMTDAPALRLVRESRRQAFAPVFLGGDGVSGIVTDTLASEGAIVAAAFTTTDQRPAAQRFTAAYRGTYGTDPQPFAALGYDATRMLAWAIEHGGATRRGVREALAGLDAAHAVRGVTGPMSFSGGGDPVNKSLSVTQVHHGRLSPITS